ncbi:CEX1 [[Candida] subhashii]|uniref:CEX1 n=1 Tax=[Candida] subhashii TaxID=561895 RepID=A0A8J5QMI5_9ASCO|nr:CEX1 [[Candida] subhashii]KAG7663266.1 CEX1 [[Candida] subhashii]
MNFIAKTFSTLTGTSIPYTIKDKIVDPLAPVPTTIDKQSIWTLYDGLNPKDNNSPVSIFEFNLREPSNNRHIPFAKNAFRQLKLIKFPHIVSCIDFIESDAFLYIITERIVPLATYLEQQIGQDAKVCGLYQVAQSLNFMNENAGVAYMNLNKYNSVVVNSQGEWKLFGFELVTKIDQEGEVYAMRNIMPGYNDVNVDDNTKDLKKVDAYRFGAFILYVFGIENVERLPGRLAGIVKKLLSSKPNLRIPINRYLKELESYHASNVIIKFNEQLTELKFLPEQEKLAFFRYTLPEYLEAESEFPPGLLNYKLLPEMIAQFNDISKKAQTGIDLERQEVLSGMLNLIIKFGIKLQADEFNKLIKPIIISSFCSSDRSIRMTLLNHLPDYHSFLSDSEVQNQIFANLITGFQDTNFLIRETTLKSITIIIDKISVKQVNQDLLRILAKSQMDPKPSIRVNTLILIIKISSKIYSTSKNNVLITALAKSLRDTFTPCKLTALQGFESLKSDFSMEEICSKILGHLAIALMDPKSTKVRNEARRIFQIYLQAVEEHAGDLDGMDEEDEDAEEREFFKKFAPATSPSKEVISDVSGDGSPADPATGGASSMWGMMSKLTSFGSGAVTGGELNQNFDRSTPDLTKTEPPTMAPLSTTVVEDIAEEGNGWDDFNDAWNQEENEIVAETKKLSIEPKPARRLPQPTKGPSPSLRTSTRTPVKASGLRLGSASKSRPKPKIDLQLKVEDDDAEDGWGDGW